jgi:hypothetical protein
VLPLRRRVRDEVAEEEGSFAPFKKRGRFDPTNIEAALKGLEEAKKKHATSEAV